MIADYLQTTWPANRIYFLGEEPGEPQLRDQRIDGVYYSGEERTHETTGVAFWVESSNYSTTVGFTSDPPGKRCWQPTRNFTTLRIGMMMLRIFPGTIICGTAITRKGGARPFCSSLTGIESLKSDSTICSIDDFL